MHEFTTTRRVEFADTDMGGICHFSRFLVFLETAEHEFLQALGTSATGQVDGRPIGWPRVAIRCEYRRPARFGQVLEIRLRVLRKGRSSLTYGFRFSHRGRELATGEMTSVCCVMDPDRGPRATPIPRSLRQRIDEAPRRLSGGRDRRRRAEARGN
jgi:4-hydroxybenzoyl-CoA thioesterase/acyl-CoA thioester hydrolase